jgi:hypothetical protein
MKDIKILYHDFMYFLHNKFFFIALLLTGIAGYGFEIVHPSIGIDDTNMALYMEDGVSPIVGRWVIFLVGKILYIGKFNPFFTEFIGVMLLGCGAVLFCVLFKRLFRDRFKISTYIIFACVFISNPIISEDYFFYLHNGIGLGYCLTALSLLCFLDAIREDKQIDKKKIGISTLLLWGAIGCYESFFLVYVTGVAIIVFVLGMQGDRNYKMMRNILCSIGIAAVSMLLRSFMIGALTWIFSLYDAKETYYMRSISEIGGLVNNQEAGALIAMILKRYWLVYIVNAVVFQPVRGYVFAFVVWGIAAVAAMIKKKNLWYPLIVLGIFAAPIALSVIGNEVLNYRTCQHIPFFTATCVFLIYIFLEKRPRWITYIVMVLAGIMVFNQSSMLNSAFYNDYTRYENAKEKMVLVAYEISKKYGNELPVLFTGTDEVPYELYQDYCVDFDSWQFKLISAITDPIDEHLKEKYYTNYGYCFAGEANRSFINWGIFSFNDNSVELNHFLAMHGYEFNAVTDVDTIESAREISAGMPSWPSEGSVTLQDGYVLVHF